MFELKLKSPVTTIQQHGQVLVCGMSNGGLIWFDQHDQIFFAENFHKNAITDTSFAGAQNDFVLSSSADSTLKLWSLEGKHVRTFKEHTSFVMCCSTCGDFAVSGGNDKQLIFWDIRSKKSVHTLQNESQILSVEMNDQIYFGDVDGTISAVDIRNFKPLYKLKHDDSVIGLHSNQNFLCSTSFDNTIRLWDVNPTPTKERLISVFDHDLNNKTMNLIRPYLSDGGHYIACGTNSGNVNIYELISQELLYTLGGHKDTVSQVFISDNVLISGGLDGSVVVGEVNIMD